MRYSSALIMGGFQLMIACSSTQKLTQSASSSTAEPIEQTEKSVVFNEPLIKKDTLPPPVFKIDTLISISYGPCFGKCRVYSLDITNDGLVYWHGYKNVSKSGLYLTKISVEQKEQLEGWLNETGIWNLSNNYPERNAYITDFPVRQFHLKYKNQSKRIEINHSPPPLIEQLESNIQSWLERSDWRRIDDK